MNDEYFKKIMITLIIIALLVLTFFILKPILLSVISGLIVAFVFFPLYNFLYKKTSSKNLSAFLICLALLLLIIVPFWFLTPIFVDQSIKFYLAVQQLDIITPLKSTFPTLFASEAFSNSIGGVLQSFITKIAQSVTNSLADLIIHFPTIFLQILVFLFTFYFALRDGDELVEYIKSLLPFSKEVERKLFEYTKGITLSVIYGLIIIGFIQGLIIGLGFFIFKVPNALFLALIACIVGILPVIGPATVWIPVVIYLLIAGNTFAAIGIVTFGLLSSSLENLLRPLFVSRRTRIHSSVVLIGMVGGFFLFGILGFLIGPLVLAYLLIVLEIYRDKRTPGLFIQESDKSSEK